MNELITLEQKSWEALSSSEEGAAQQFYNSLLAEDAVMVFPGGMLIQGKENILGSFGAQPWQSFRLEEPQALMLSENAGVVIYRVTAQREGSDPYDALISSVYAKRDGRWKLSLHQQTQA